MYSANKLVLRLFKGLGGNLREKHPVTHWFYFREEQNLTELEKYLNTVGFCTLTKNLKREQEKEKLLLIVVRNEILNEDSLNFDTTEFSKLAEEFQGEYDGWETKIE